MGFRCVYSHRSTGQEVDGLIMKLWVDDERPAPDDTWVVTETSGAAKDLIRLWRGSGRPDRFEEISLDHDLGGEDTGMLVLEYMVLLGFWPRTVTIHTSNPPARQRMLATTNAEAPAEVDINVIYW